MQIRIQRIHPDARLCPHYAHGPAEDAGMDLRAVEERHPRAGQRRAWSPPA